MQKWDELSYLLMQCLDNLVHGQIVIAATNREDILDKALKRRFRNKVEFTKFNENEELKMIEKFVESIDLMEMDQELIEYTKGNHTQSETMDFLVEKLIQKGKQGSDLNASENNILRTDLSNVRFVLCK